MNIDEFLIKNPTFGESDLDFLKIDGIYDENAIKGLDDNINRDRLEPVVGEYKPIFVTSTRPMIQSSKQSSFKHDLSASF